MKWEDFRVGQTVQCGGYDLKIISVMGRRVRYVSPYDYKDFIVVPEAFTLVEDSDGKPFNKFKHHKDRVENRHLLDKKEPVSS